MGSRKYLSWLACGPGISAEALARLWEAGRYSDRGWSLGRGHLGLHHQRPVRPIAPALALKPGDFVHTLGDAHLYANHFEQARELLSRMPKALPTLWMNPEVKDLFAFRLEGFRLENYAADASIKAPIAV